MKVQGAAADGLKATLSLRFGLQPRRQPEADARSDGTCNSWKGWSTHWPAGGPKQLWKAKAGVGYSSMAVSNGQLYTMGNTAETDHVLTLVQDCNGLVD